MIKGTSVKTNDKYFEKFGRITFGNVVSVHKNLYCIVNVKQQIGKVIPEHTGQDVAFLVRDLVKA
ncbi:hypothetical protein [Bacillus toyonensis]|uniref:hypothetical protein n=1 Tax=Bacillus toyonensis TaxID=155322 RepID=UPI002E238EF2|nr:hypothetical protein [Bacillus toyonensis]